MAKNNHFFHFFGLKTPVSVHPLDFLLTGSNLLLTKENLMILDLDMKPGRADILSGRPNFGLCGLI